MPDGSSGLSLSEMGISSVKKTAQAVKKQATPFVQGVKQQLTGQGPKQQVPSAYSVPSSQPPSEGIASTVFDLFNPAKKQGSSSTNNNQNPPQQNPQVAIPPKAAPPPSEQINQQNSGTFDLSGANQQQQNEQTLFEKGNSNQSVLNNPPKNMPFTTIVNKTAEERDMEKQRQIEGLRKKLHDAYFEQFEKRSEGDEQKEETVQERLEREEQEKKQKLMIEQEEERKKAPVVPLSVKGRQGAHEGLKQKG